MSGHQMAVKLSLFSNYYFKEKGVDVCTLLPSEVLKIKMLSPHR
jgi:hypothetical protein